MYLNGAQTDRLNIRKLEIGDIEVWRTFFENNSYLKYLGLDLSLDSKTQSIDWIERQLWRYDNNSYGHHALIDKNTNKFVGQCGLLTQEVENKKEIEIGYHILPKYWGKGYATEAAKKIRDFAFENEITDTLISIIDIRNAASQKVAEKIGMKRTKQIKYDVLDVYVYRINIEPTPKSLYL